MVVIRFNTEYLASLCIFVVAVLFTLSATSVAASSGTKTRTTCTNRRPPQSSRRFVSYVIDNYIDQVVTSLNEQNRSNLACIFQNAFPNTLDTTVLQAATAAFNETTFIITGDIPAMWLRDSMNQVLPYMPFAKKDSKLQNMLRGLIQQQTIFILNDPYANAHYLPSLGNIGLSPNIRDQTTYPNFAGTRTNAMIPGIYERKYELDSLCAFLKLSRVYYDNTNDLTPFAGNTKWIAAVQSVVDVMRKMQQSTTVDDEYQFQRQAFEPTDTLLHGMRHPGKGVVTGMIRSSFRPSDDATTFPFLIPANAMAVVELQETSKLVLALAEDEKTKSKNRDNSAKTQLLTNISNDLISLSNEIHAGIQKYGIGIHPILGIELYAYEVDGYGNMYYADDANIPSLLSLPYLGYVNITDPVYQNTRQFVWSDSNPWFFHGTDGEGIGGPHVGINYVWPMSIIMKALTSNDGKEITNCFNALIESTASTGLMHESFHKDNRNSFTRPWFAWANSLFAALVIKLYGDDRNANRSISTIAE